MSIKVKRGLAINLPTLEEGELGFTTDSYEMYVGSDNGNILLNNGEILIRRNNGMLQYAQSSRKNQWFDICSLEEIRGDQGVQGIQGIQGVKGDKGDKGERGIQGEKGNPFTYADFTPDQLRALKGEKGDTGAKGERGLTGDKGDRGVGLNYSWSGTRLGVKRDTDAQYTYVDLRGADGKDGKQGERGERGIQGEKGETPSIAHLEQQVSDKSKELDTKFNTLTAKQQQDAEVVTARDGEVSLNARLERDLAKGKIHFVDVEGSNISIESEEGYLENVEIHGNTWQNAENLADIRSVGTKVEGQELYEIPVLSTGKNLFDKNKIVYNFWLDSTGNIGIGTGASTTRNYLDYTRVKGGSTLKIHGITVTAFFVYSDIGTYLPCTFNYSNYTVKLPQNAKYIRFTFDSTKDFSNAQIEEGTQATSFEEYKEDKLTILSPTPLEKVGDVADRIICKDGVWGVEKNVGTQIFNSDSKWTVNSTYENYIDFICQNIIPNDITYGLQENRLIASIRCYKKRTSSSTGKLILQYDINNAPGLDANGFTEYVANNPFILKYQTTEPQFIPLPHDQQVKLRTFADRTHIHFDTEIQPTIKAQVPKSLGATVNTHTTQIDNLNKELDRVKKLEESTVSTVTSSKAFTTVAETNQGYFEDVKIEGKTLVNLVIEGENSTDYKLGAYVFNTPTDDIHDRRCHVKCSHLKPSTVYTVVMNADIRVKPTQGAIIDTYDSCGSQASSLDYWKINTTGKQLIVHKVVTRDTFDEGVNKNWGLFHLSSIASTADVTVSNIMVLEGDHTDKDISYFEGLKSVGQDANEIEILSHNKNLWNVEKVKTQNNTLPPYTKNNNTITYTNVGQYGIYIPIIAKKNETLRISGTINNVENIRIFKESDEFKGTGIYNASYGGKETILTTQYACTFPEDGVYHIRIWLHGNEQATLTNFLVEINNTNTTYEEHKYNKKQILYYNPNTQTWEKPVLREWDSIEKHADGKYYYHKRTSEIKLNGSERWSHPAWSKEEYWLTKNPGGFAYEISLIDIGKTSGDTVICDKFGYNTIKISSDLTVGNCVVNGQYLAIATNKLTSIEGFKQWLQANPVTVVYQLAKEEVYECTNLDLITYSGETNLIVNSGVIQPKVTLKVLSNVSNVIKLLQEKVSILENKFIKGLQQVLAGDMMSLAHLLYPEDFALENDTPQVIPYIEEGDINE